MENESTNDKGFGKRGIKSKLNCLKKYKAIIFVLAIISLLSIANSILIYQYAIEIQNISTYNSSQEKILLGQVKKEVDSALKTNNIDNFVVSLTKIQNKLDSAIMDYEQAVAENIDLQNHIENSQI